MLHALDLRTQHVPRPIQVLQPQKPTNPPQPPPTPNRCHRPRDRSNFAPTCPAGGSLDVIRQAVAAHEKQLRQGDEGQATHGRGQVSAGEAEVVPGRSRRHASGASGRGMGKHTSLWLDRDGVWMRRVRFGWRGRRSSPERAVISL